MRKENLIQLLRCLIAVLMVLSLVGCRSDNPVSADPSDTGGQLQATDTALETTAPDETEPSEATEPSRVTDPSAEATVTTTATETTAPADTTPADTTPAQTMPTATEPVQTTAPAAEPVQTAPPHSHSYTAAGTVDPNCESQGYTTYTCACGSSYKDSYTAALGHSYSSTVVAATYDAGGYTQHTCTRCGSSYTSDETPKLEAAPLDYAAAEAYGNQYAVDTYGGAYGWTINYDLNFDNAGFNFPYTASVEGVNNKGGQQSLNTIIKNCVDSLYETLSRRAGGGFGAAVNCDVYERDGTIYFYVYYG